ncbi:MAG: hypothetical protein FJ104_15515 [Deltaproteobacteria bacterium]|nr:hypothetical protein [Deltaproteobacteria bacterium]
MLALRRGLLALGLVVAAVGCRSVEALRADCEKGDDGACEQACEKGATGQGGCFYAAEALRRTAGGDVTGPVGDRLRALYARSCDGGEGAACLMLAELVSLAHPAPEPGSVVSPSARVSDAELAERESRLVRGCDLGHAPSCRRLGDALIGRSSDRAGAAYAAACDAGSDKEACRAARAREVATAEAWRVGCTSGAASGCERLGDLLFAVDPLRALRLFAVERQLRGIPGEELEFLRERLARAARGLPSLEPSGPVTPLDPGAVRVQAGLPVVTGQLAIVEVDAVLRRANPSLGRCVAAEVPGREEAFELVVDRTGDVYRAVPRGAGLGAPAVACLSRELEALEFSAPPSGVVKVVVPLRVVPPEIAAPAEGLAPDAVIGARAPGAGASPATK